MGTFRRGAVTFRISEKDMQKALERCADVSAGGAAHFLAQLSQKYIDQNDLIDKGHLKNSITVSRGGALKGQGIVWRVTSLARIAPHNNIIHGGRGPIRSSKGMHLAKRRNDSKKSVLVWRTKFVSAVAPKPFLSVPGQALRERDFAHPVQRANPTGKPLPKSKTAAEKVAETLATIGEGKFTKGQTKKFYGRG